MDPYVLDLDNVYHTLVVFSVFNFGRGIQNGYYQKTSPTI